MSVSESHPVSHCSCGDPPWVHCCACLRKVVDLDGTWIHLSSDDIAVLNTESDWDIET